MNPEVWKERSQEEVEAFAGLLGYGQDDEIFEQANAVCERIETDDQYIWVVDDTGVVRVGKYFVHTNILDHDDQKVVRLAQELLDLHEVAPEGTFIRYEIPDESSETMQAFVKPVMGDEGVVYVVGWGFCCQE